MHPVIVIIIIILLLADLAAALLLYFKLADPHGDNELLNRIEKTDSHQKEIYQRLSNQQNKLRQELSDQDRHQRQEISSSVQNSFSALGQILSENLSNTTNAQSDRLAAMEDRLKTFSLENEQKLSSIRTTIEQRLDRIQSDNNTKLDEMRAIVTEKLNRTIDKRMTESFKLVNDRLEQVYKGLGEMQTLASGVGDLKKVLSNVKTRGILGEIQLGAILREILSPEQYIENAAVKPGSRNVVEFAVKLPSQDGSTIVLPIDSKFPGDTYLALKNAYENGEAQTIDAAAKQLIRTIKSEAKDIHDKYIAPPYTTDFAVMFLPFEGLYAEAVNRGLIETLAREYKVCIAGPSTMGALLNSLQMGLRTLAVQQRSAEVWRLLEDVSSEFDNFAKALSQTQDRLRAADSELEKLVGVRTRQMQRRLSQISQFNSDLPQITHGNRGS